MPLLGLSVGDECINKIIPSGFLTSVVLWVLFQMAREPGTPQDEPGTPPGAVGCAADRVGWHDYCVTALLGQGHLA